MATTQEGATKRVGRRRKTNSKTSSNAEIVLFQKLNQWPFQEPKLEVPTIYKAYIRPM